MAAIKTIDSVPDIVLMLDALENLPTQPPSLYCDVEGVNLSRNGTISIIQIYAKPLDRIYLVDVHCLKEAVFHTPSTVGTTLKSVFEDNSIPKVFFDDRNDSENLRSQFKIRLQGVHDLQVMEASMRHGKHRSKGLADCIKQDARISSEDMMQWERVKNAGQELSNPKKGGSWQVFNVRPIMPQIVEYCTQDVVHMPALWEAYAPKTKNL